MEICSYNFDDFGNVDIWLKIKVYGCYYMNDVGWINMCKFGIENRYL